MKIMLRNILTSALFLATAYNTQAQDKISYYDLTKDRNLMLNFGGGTANYFGDFVNPSKLGLVRPSLNIEAEYYVLDLLSVRTELGWFQIAGKDSKADDDRWERNLNFRSNAVELNLTAALHLFPQISTFYPRPRINPYVFGGVGYMFGNPKAQYKGDWVALQPLMTEDVEYKRLNFVVPAGIGAKFMINPYMNIIGQVGYRFAFTDYLDDVSVREYPVPSTLNSDLARALSDRRAEIGTKPSDPNLGKRGNPAKDDHYMLMNVKLQYYLPVEIFKKWEAKTRSNKAKRLEARETRKNTPDTNQ